MRCFSYYYYYYFLYILEFPKLINLIKKKRKNWRGLDFERVAEQLVGFGCDVLGRVNIFYLKNKEIMVYDGQRGEVRSGHRSLFRSLCRFTFFSGRVCTTIRRVFFN